MLYTRDDDQDERLKSFYMDIYDTESRLMVLHCIRENALNMRQVYQNSFNYDGTNMELARLDSLVSIEQLDVQLGEMKSIVEQVIVTMDENPGEIDHNELVAIEEICEILIDAVGDDVTNQIDFDLQCSLRGIDSFQTDSEDMEY